MADLASEYKWYVYHWTQCTSAHNYFITFSATFGILQVHKYKECEQIIWSWNHRCSACFDLCVYVLSGRSSSLYLQEWNKVLLFQIIAARLGQKVKKFGCVIMTGLKHSVERKQMVSGSLSPFQRAIWSPKPFTSNIWLRINGIYKWGSRIHAQPVLMYNDRRIMI